jgi:hypothetical protein
MEDKYEIREYPAIEVLYAKRDMWIAAYFKGLYHGRMTYTQRSESKSTNKVMKDGFVNIVTSLHQFAVKMLEALQHMDHMDAEESHGARVRTMFRILCNCSVMCYGQCYNCTYR